MNNQQYPNQPPSHGQPSNPQYPQQPHYPPPPPPHYPHQPQYPQQEPKKNNRTMIILLLVLVPLLIVGSIFAYKAFSKDDKIVLAQASLFGENLPKDVTPVPEDIPVEKAVTNNSSSGGSSSSNTPPSKPKSHKPTVPVVKNIASVWKNSIVSNGQTDHLTVTFFDLIIKNGTIMGGRICFTWRAEGFIGEVTIYENFTMIAPDEYQSVIINAIETGEHKDQLLYQIGEVSNTKFMLFSSNEMVFHDAGSAPTNFDVWTKIR